MEFSVPVMLANICSGELLNVLIAAHTGQSIEVGGGMGEKG
jgi:hypothetical protein